MYYHIGEEMVNQQWCNIIDTGPQQKYFFWPTPRENIVGDRQFFEHTII